MQMSDINGIEVSRFGLGTKRFPTEDSSRVIHMDQVKVKAIMDTCASYGVNLVETSYSNHKGEAEAFLGKYTSRCDGRLYTCTSYFEMVDPRYEYVFQKQLKKLERQSIDFYFIEGVTDMNKEVNIASGAVDYFFERKEAGEISQLGFSSELDPANLEDFLGRYPWDFVRMRITYHDWFVKGVKECYEVAASAGIPIMAHGALRVGPSGRIKDEALAILKEADPQRTSVDWALRFVKSLDAVKAVTTNVYSEQQAIEDIAVFCDDAILDDRGFDVLRDVAQAQRTRRPGA